MNVRDLSTPNKTTLRFSSAGLLTAVEMRPGASLQYLDEMLASASLGPSVSREVKGFDRLKAVHRYGLFNYGSLTVAATEAGLIIELALGVRFAAAGADGVEQLGECRL